MNTLPARHLPRTGHTLTALGLGGAPLGNLYNVISEADAREHLPLAAAAVQFPLAHPAVVSVAPGARNASELEGIVRWMRHPIPPALWQALCSQGLMHADAPVPMG
jgi:D-threo-aldose 1-dehydrogenase